MSIEEEEFDSIINESIDTMLGMEDVIAVGGKTKHDVDGEDLDDSIKHVKDNIDAVNAKDSKRKRMSNVTVTDSDQDGAPDGVANISDKKTFMKGIYGESYMADKAKDSLNRDSFAQDLGGNGQPLDHTKIRCGYCDGTGKRGLGDCQHCYGEGKTDAKETQPGQAKDQPTSTKVSVDDASSVS